MHILKNLVGLDDIDDDVEAKQADHDNGSRAEGAENVGKHGYSLVPWRVVRRRFTTGFGRIRKALE